MNKRIVILFAPIAMAILFAGCNAEEIFSKLATSDVEESAKEAFNQSQQLAEKQQKIENLKKSYPEYVDFRNINDTNNFVAAAFRKLDDSGASFEVEAQLTNPGSEFYEVWVRGANPKDVVSLGAMKFNKTDDYSLKMTTTDKLKDFNTILISRETTPDTKLETVIMTGSFVEKSTSPSPASK